MTTKKPIGRPRTTVDDLPENWKDIMIECGSEGGSEVEMRVLLGIGESAWYTLCDDSEEFQRTRKRAKDLCEVWWERRGRKMASGEDGNPTVWIFNMKNRFNWRDKQDIQQDIKAEVQTSGVLVAPPATTAQSWEEAAQAQQEQLKADAKAASDGTSES